MCLVECAGVDVGVCEEIIIVCAARVFLLLASAALPSCFRNELLIIYICSLLTCYISLLTVNVMDP
jgi:hypothetical protein